MSDEPKSGREGKQVSDKASNKDKLSMFAQKLIMTLTDIYSGSKLNNLKLS